MRYYSDARTPLSLNKDAPVPRAVQAVGTFCGRQFSADYTITMLGFDFRQGHHALASITECLVAFPLCRAKLQASFSPFRGPL
jgi:hypothetical protein